MIERATWDQTWLRVAMAVAQRSRCVNSAVGAVVVTYDNRLNSTGYNGPPRGLKLDGDCAGWCPRAQGEKTIPSDYSACASIHAEVNALLRADATVIENGKMYVTRAPCINCAKIVANSGVRSVFCARTEEDAHAAFVFDYLRDCGIWVAYHSVPKERS
jgi:dCMP deaminase